MAWHPVSHERPRESPAFIGASCGDEVVPPENEEEDSCKDGCPIAAVAAGIFPGSSCRREVRASSSPSGMPNSGERMPYAASSRFAPMLFFKRAQAWPCLLECSKRGGLWEAESSWANHAVGPFTRRRLPWHAVF